MIGEWGKFGFCCIIVCWVVVDDLVCVLFDVIEKDFGWNGKMNVSVGMCFLIVFYFLVDFSFLFGEVI